MQFVNLYNNHQNKQISPKNLHWGEEMEYHLYSFDADTKTVKLSCEAVAILAKYAEFTDAQKDEIGFKLMPEFGRWMIEAVPANPYRAYSDPEVLLSCYDAISQR